MLTDFKMSFSATKAGLEDILHLDCSCGWEQLFILPHEDSDATLRRQGEKIAQGHFVTVHGFEPKIKLEPSQFGTPEASLEEKSKKKGLLPN